MIDNKEIIKMEMKIRELETKLIKLRALEVPRFLEKLSEEEFKEKAKEIIGNEDYQAITEANIRKLKKKLHALQVQKFYQHIEELQKSEEKK